MSDAKFLGASALTVRGMWVTSVNWSAENPTGLWKPGPTPEDKLIIVSESEDEEDMPLTNESDSDDETGGPVVDDDEFEVFKVLEGVVDACCCRSPGPVWCEPESLEGVVFD